MSYVEDAGDPYKEEMEECIRLIVDELKKMGVRNDHVLAYQSRVGPVEWLKPYTDDVIRELGEREPRRWWRCPSRSSPNTSRPWRRLTWSTGELAEESGVEKWGRVPALDTDPTFIDDLADAVMESLESMRATTPAPGAAPVGGSRAGAFPRGAGAVPPVPMMPAGSGIGSEIPDVGDLLGVKPEPWQWGRLGFRSSRSPSSSRPCSSWTRRRARGSTKLSSSD